MVQTHAGGFWDTLEDIFGGVSTAGNKVANTSSTVGGVSNKVSEVSNAVGGISRILSSIWDLFTGNSGNSSNSEDTNNIFDNAESIASSVSGIAGAISNISDIVSDIANAVSSAGGEFGDIIAKLKSLTQPVQQGGHSQAYINRVLCLLVALILLIVGSCYFLEKQFPQVAPAPGRPRLWLSGMLLTSYAILIPGLVQTLFSFTIGIGLLGLHVTVTTSSEDSGKPGAITESMISVVSTLRQTGSTLGAALVVIYAMVLPALKLVLLCVGELWRFSEVPGRVVAARWSIRFVQFISKWACPDMFAYILLLYLLRSLGERSTLLAVPAHLDDGFSCFSIFCVCSTFSSLAIHLPDADGQRSGREASEGGPQEASPQEALPLGMGEAESKGGSRGLLWLVGLLFINFAILFCLGLLLPCMALKLESSLLVQPQGPLPAAVMPFLQALNLESQVDSDVSMMECLAALVKWLYYGEANCILALIMLGLFALLLPVVNMIVLVFAAEAAASEPSDDQDEKALWVPTSAMDVARVLKHISMLDVAIMGVVVICLAGKSYRQQGIVFMLRPGLLFLFLAEVVHYVTYYIVQSKTKSAKAQTASQAS